ncbi:MAG: hypothetical protein JSS66_06020 [Armatimonadetes bacterium]|nr:hypothetical protein [Armatimonadota bacterium]
MANRKPLPGALNDAIVVLDNDGTEVPGASISAGTYEGVLTRGSFGASIKLDGGVHLCFRSPWDVPDELAPKFRGENVPVRVTVSIDSLERIVYDAVRIT